MTLIMLTDGPNWIGRLVGAPWYTQKSRLQPLALLLCLLLIAGAIEWLLAKGKKVFLRRPLRGYAGPSAAGGPAASSA